MVDAAVLANLAFTALECWVSDRNFEHRAAFFNMPLFYFRYDDNRALTDEGMWFPDLDMAEREAREIVVREQFRSL